MNGDTKPRYIESMVVSLIGIFLLLTEDFGGWQDADIFFGVVEGYVWIGSTQTFPIAQILILSLSACLAYIAYVSYMGYSQKENVSRELLEKGIRVSKIQVRITVVSAILFIVLAFTSDWWWLGPGFYGAVISGIVNWWVYKQLL